VIALVLAASGAALYMMRKQGMGAGNQVLPAQDRLQRGQNVHAADDVHQQQVLSDLEKSQNPTQVPPDKIQKNPFQLDTHGPTMTAMAGDQDAIKSAQAKELQALRQNQITTALASIEVNAIMEGDKPLARINGKDRARGRDGRRRLQGKGDHDRSVDLEADGKLFTVNMSENTAAASPACPRRGSKASAG